MGVLLDDWDWDRLGRYITAEIARAEERGDTAATDELLQAKHVLNDEKRRLSHEREDRAGAEAVA